MKKKTYQRILVIIAIILFLALGIWALTAMLQGNKGDNSHQDAILADETQEEEDTWPNMTNPVDPMDLMTGTTEASAATVQIQTEDNTGCGVIWDFTKDSIMIATASHVVTNWQQVTVNFGIGGSISAEVVYISDVYDVAFVQIDCNTLEKAVLESLKQATIREEAVERGTELFMLYFDEDLLLIHITGSVLEESWYFEELSGELIYCAADVHPGMSGTGVFDENARLMGILVGASDEQEAAVLSVAQIKSAFSDADL